MPKNVLRTHVCPSCRKEFRYRDLREVPHFPFCSERCKLVDLGRWLMGGYHVPGAPAAGSEDDEKNP